jgi:hypothetical protein
MSSLAFYKARASFANLTSDDKSGAGFSWTRIQFGKKVTVDKYVGDAQHQGAIYTVLRILDAEKNASSWRD